MLKKELKKLIGNSINDLQDKKELPRFKIPKIEIECPKQEGYGDYSTNIALRIVQESKESPLKTAELIVQSLNRLISEPLFEKVEAVKPGFINFFLSDHLLLKNLDAILRKKEKYGANTIGKGKTVVIDYSSPNIAKPFNIGHLRSTIIGQAIYNIYRFLGYKAIGDNHIGDWGTQYGKLFYAIQKWGDEKKINNNPIEELYRLYVKFHKRAEKDPGLEEEGRKCFRRLEEGDKEIKRVWEKSVEWSLKEFDNIYKTLDVEFDFVLGESFYQPFADDVIQEALHKKVAKKSRGAIIIEFPDKKLPPLMIQKSDGTTLYSTRDLAAIKYRKEKFKPYKIIYEVGADQTLYFRQLFWAAELLGWGKRNDYFHVAHGLMRFKKGKMSTRKGKVVFLEEVLEEAIKRAREIIESKNPNLKHKEKIAKAVGIGAVKYNDLSHHYSRDIVFDWEQALSLKGNSAPYLQYTYARACSVLKKDNKRIKIGKRGKKIEKKEERMILELLFQFPEVVKQAAEQHSPNLICNFLFELAQAFNFFYEHLPILKAETEESKKIRIDLTSAFAQIIKNGLGLLGIETPKKM